MGKGSQFLLLLWKNLTLLKRTPVRTFFQISMPLLFITILVLLRALVVKDEHRPNITYTAFDINQLPPLNEDYPTKWKMAFTPNTTNVKRVMAMVANQLSLEVEGFQSEETMVKALVSEEQNGDKHSNVMFLGGIVFNKTLDSRDVIYKIRLSSSSKKKKKNPYVFELPGPRGGNSTHGGPPDYFGEGFLSLQHAVDFAIIKFKGNIEDLNATVSVKRFPYPDYIHDPFILVIQGSLPLLLMLSLVFTALNIVRDIVYEKEKKLKESMKMMGLSGWLHWLAWFTKYFIFLLITMGLATIFFTVKYNDNGQCP
ncbi:ATP-binding cassette sub- A member 3 [Desmophyllum pertusum]|uniref:ATP-binding cassette sub- A member 3 n=1 Tax=Desmophyllum pertusum TaxID=174260 RepID=A0A9X0CSM1_9CNID|nr:ATP-binding cassette sub- A member 3 [Desmophyllum pertusum]